ncbi:MAG TPA: DUF1553 domain-containing protein, partial [Bryobacterales bacterium]|nr:DUF1553 domain-containing protein [Bryobacterales bacterium]
GKRFIDAGKIAAYGFYDKFTLAAWINPAAPTGAIVTHMQDVSEPSGYGLMLKDGHVQLDMAARWLDDALRVETADPIEMNRWHHVLATYDGSREAAGVRIYVDGRPQKIKAIIDELNQSFASKEPLRIGAGGGPPNRFHGSIDDVRVYHEALSPEDAAIVATAASVRDIAALPPAERAKAQSDKIRLAFLETSAPAEIRQPWRSLEDLEIERARFVESLPTVMVMQEMPERRETHILIRGAYDHPGEKVSPGVPAILGPLPAGAPNNRLGFARWLVDPANPLTARVIVNRFWQGYFGVGIVKTVEDFGSQGEWPSHPDLLDWLATEFMRSGWNIKAMQKLIVTSATYRQSSQVTPELQQRDPENRLLARGPRVRLGAGVIRDQALAVAGLLVEKVGGPSAKPYQPAGLWEEVSGQKYKQDHGDNLYRRSLYTFWKRTIPPPSMMNFDAAGRETCVVRLTRTNTPLQALDLMNDVTYLEASRVLGERMMKEGGSTPEDRIAFAFRLATARRPSAQESQVLLDDFRYQLDNYKTGRDAALKYLSEGEHKRDESLDPTELAAYTTVASLILNLDETVTKE